MKKAILFTILSASFLFCKAQNISFGYDEAGNRNNKNIVTLKSTSDIVNDEVENKAYSEITEKLVISIYPNPVKEILTIKINGNEEGYCHSIQLFDFNGRMSLSRETCDETIPVSFANMSPGIYILKIITNGSLSEWKIIRE